jgi:hypothetical protein
MGKYPERMQIKAKHRERGCAAVFRYRFLQAKGRKNPDKQ